MNYKNFKIGTYFLITLYIEKSPSGDKSAQGQIIWI